MGWKEGVGDVPLVRRERFGPSAAIERAVGDHRGRGEPGRLRAQTGCWKDHGSELDAQLFNAGNTFGTREEAVLQGVRFGQRIIDGVVPGCSVAGL